MYNVINPFRYPNYTTPNIVELWDAFKLESTEDENSIMTDQDYTDITMILDASGSMCNLKQETISSVNNFIQEQKKVKGKCKLTLVTFNSIVNTVIDAVDIKECELLNDRSYNPGGYTALLDAMGQVIVSTGVRLKAMPANRRPGKVLIVTITDGQENSSREYSVAHGGREKIKNMVTHQSDKYDWDFVYLGANQDSFLTSAELGVKSIFTQNYDATKIGTHAIYSNFSEGVKMYRSASLGDKMGVMAAAVADVNKTDVDNLVTQIDTANVNKTGSKS